MVSADLPQCLVTAHAMVSSKQIHDCVLERMAHMQTAGDIWWWYGDAVGSFGCACCKAVVGFPALIDGLLNIGGLVLIVQCLAHDK